MTSQPHNFLRKPSDLAKSLADAQDLARPGCLPDREVCRLRGQFLQMQARMIGAKQVLEIGMLVGYSAIWLASASPEIRVTTIEVDARYVKVARRALQHARLADRVEVLVGAGVDVLKFLDAAIAAAKRAKFDFVFIDADKPNVVVDNVVRGGMVVDEPSIEKDSKVKGSREVTKFAGKDERVSAATMI